jgi:ribosome-associated heat shock protein Hsp15
LDKWLWFARLTRTRGQAQELAESRHLRLDGRVIERCSALVRPGSILSYPWQDEVRVVRVEAIADRRGPFVEAQHLYTDLTRPLTAEPAHV